MTDHEPDWQPVATAPAGRWLRTRREGEAGENVCSVRRYAATSSTFGILVDHEADEWVERHSHVTTVTHKTFLPPTHWAPLAAYCLGLLFDDYDEVPQHVVLARKRRPQREESQLGGVGRVISEDISPEVMRSIFLELGGIDVAGWRALAVIEAPTWTTHYFYARTSLARVATGAYSLGEERLTVRSVSTVLNDPTLSPTIRWLLPLATDDRILKPLRVRDRG